MQQSSFNLTRQFALLSFLTILLIGAVSAFSLSRLFTEKILTRDATVSQEFIDSIVTADGTWRFFTDTQNPGNLAALQEFFDHVAHMPDVVRANVYGGNMVVLWSSEPEIIGRRFPDNEELETTLLGKVNFESGIIGETEKQEHRNLGEDHSGIRFIETYIPIWNPGRQEVVGAVELYKLPRALHQSIVEGQRLIWASAFMGGLLLFSVLYWIVRRANLVMQSQHQQLIESKSLSMIGETASAVAHSMRNPLASIRACAELTLTDDLEGARESARDIIGEADRLDRWARELLQFSAWQHGDTEKVEINALVNSVLEGHQSEITRASVHLHAQLADEPLVVKAIEAPLSQVVGNLVTNAVEAMGDGGTLSVVTELENASKSVSITIRDTGPGFSEEMEGRLFRPFATTKSNGTGLGLALSKRLIEHFEGSIELQNTREQGVTVTLRLPAVD